MLARVRSLSNLECVGETLRATLDDVARAAADWLVGHISPDWFERYRHRVENYRLPKAESQRTALAEQIGADGVHLLAALEQADAPLELREMESVQVLRQVWQQYYDLSGGHAKWRAGPQTEEQEGVLDLTGYSEQQLDELLAKVEIKDVWGIGHKYALFLRNYGITTAKELKYDRGRHQPHLWERYPHLRCPGSQPQVEDAPVEALQPLYHPLERSFASLNRG